ncbi:hypothetical protein EC973_007526 [Apophysomyces ossiformis]|uniref:Uncharacterized protein n=1 Tax=Apophysomyces ossiformis TaxID=679940 RepID=A0A8H7BM54_9FUNG|nr:hypothetical protein EC973_007526 [Apophysomyces ossiformis]
MENPPFAQYTAYIIHVVLTYIYVVLLIVLFLGSMGNRPQGSKKSYTSIMVFFALLMVYVIFASIWLAYAGITSAVRSAQTVPLLLNGSFRDIILSMAATYAIFLLASLLFLDPWHMFTSIIQYLAMAPSYISVLNTYAFCNTHDVSWGTKDISAVSLDLGVVEVKQDRTIAEVDMFEKKDVHLLYEKACTNLRNKVEEKPVERDAKTKQEDYYRAFRTRLVVCWIISNLILVAVISAADTMDWLGDPFVYGYPTAVLSFAAEGAEPTYASASFWEKVVIVMVLVLLGGVFAGLTLGLMGLDETNLHVLIESGTPEERENAKKVLALLDRGKHWVLVTLLLSNVIINETLPIILDGILSGGWQAVVISTALIVIFGEMVLVLMYIMYPIAYPTALLLDYFLGESHGTVYKKSGLKSLVSLHQAVNPSDVEALTADEVTIIGAVLDLRSKPVSQIMTPIADVFTLSVDDILDEQSVDKILTAGYSRIPVHSPGDNTNFVGMLLTKRLITYDPEDGLPVKELQISTLPETGPDTSCLDILNFFQEGKSHMALVSSDPGGQSGALGVITLEDVIEELIGEEIIDETDVYVDVRNKIRVVRRQVTNKKLNRSQQLLSARKRQTYGAGEKPNELVRSTSSNSITPGKVIEPYQKTYGAVTNGKLASTSPGTMETSSLLGNRD